MGDDHGWEETGCDHPHVKTPVIDEMASQAQVRLLLLRAFQLLTNAREFPDRTPSGLTGLSIRLLDPSEITIAHLLNEGIPLRTLWQWHIGPVKSASPTNGAMGFDDYVSAITSSR